MLALLEGNIKIQTGAGREEPWKQRKQLQELLAGARGGGGGQHVVTKFLDGK